MRERETGDAERAYCLSDSWPLLNVMRLVHVVVEPVKAPFPPVSLSSREYRRRLFRSGTLRVEVDQQRIWMEEHDEAVA